MQIELCYVAAELYRNHTFYFSTVMTFGCGRPRSATHSKRGDRKEVAKRRREIGKKKKMGTVLAVLWTLDRGAMTYDSGERS